LRVGEIIASNGMTVTFLSPTRAPIRTADMLVKWKRDIYVEVKRFTANENSWRLMTRVAEYCNRQGIRAQVDAKLGKDLSVSRIGFRERRRSEKIAQRCFDQFSKKLRFMNAGTLPFDIESDMAVFHLLPTRRPRSHIGMVGYSGIVVPTDKYVERLELELEDKARKRDSWVGRRRKVIYIVAMHIEDSIIDPTHTMETALLGWRDSYGPGVAIPAVSLPRKVRRAISMGWGPFLQSKCVTQNSGLRTQVEFNTPAKRGFYFRRRVARNISGVISVYGARQAEITPNPYADDEINDPNLAGFL